MLPIHFYFIIAPILLQVAATCAFFVHVANARLTFTQSFQGQARAEERELAKQSQARAEERELAMNQNERAEVKERELAPKAGAVTGKTYAMSYSHTVLLPPCPPVDVSMNTHTHTHTHTHTLVRRCSGGDSGLCLERIAVANKGAWHRNWAAR